MDAGNAKLEFYAYGILSHSAFGKLAEQDTNGIQLMTWPANSLNLNLIEAVWSQVKDFIERKYPNLSDGKERLYDGLLVIEREALESVKPENLAKLFKSMP